MVLSPHEEDHIPEGFIYYSSLQYDRQDFFVLGDDEEQPEVRPQSVTNSTLPVDDSNSVWSCAQKIRSDQPGDVSLPYVYKSKRAEDEVLGSSNYAQSVGEQREPDAIEMESGSEDDNAILVEQTMYKSICRHRCLGKYNFAKDSIVCLVLKTQVVDQNENSSALGEEEREFDDNDVESPNVWEEQSHPPWWRGQDMIGQIHSPLLRLHYEILDFQAFMAPTASEAEQRAKALDRVKAVVIDLFPSANLQVFGSYATNLYLPTSDIDCVILNSNCHNIARGLYAISRSLSRRGLVRTVQVIAKARVPIIKFEERESRVNFDISFDKSNGPEAAVWVNSILLKNPEIKPLCLVLKLFLQQRELNEVYTGGIGSYSLLVMLYVHVLLHEGRRSAKNSHRRKYHEHNLGSLLIDFFRTFGQDLNYEEVGLSTLLPNFFQKSERAMLNPSRPYLLAIQDPQDFTNDLGRNSYNISKIKKAFEYAYQLLSTGSNYFVKKRPVSILEKLVRRDTVLAKRDKVISHLEIPVSNKSPKSSKQKNKPEEKRCKAAHKQDSAKSLYEKYLVKGSKRNRQIAGQGDNERDPNVNYAEAAVKIPGIGFADGLEPFTGGGSPDTFNHSRKDPRGQAYKRARHR